MKLRIVGIDKDIQLMHEVIGVAITKEMVYVTLKDNNTIELFIDGIGDFEAIKIEQNYTE